MKLEIKTKFHLERRMFDVAISNAIFLTDGVFFLKFNHTYHFVVHASFYRTLKTATSHFIRSITFIVSRLWNQLSLNAFSFTTQYTLPQPLDQ